MRANSVVALQYAQHTQHNYSGTEYSDSGGSNRLEPRRATIFAFYFIYITHATLLKSSLLGGMAADGYTSSPNLCVGQRFLRLGPTIHANLCTNAKIRASANFGGICDHRHQHSPIEICIRNTHVLPATVVDDYVVQSERNRTVCSHGLAGYLRV